ncbi:hypothetical protein BAE46_00545 [Glaciecola punicea]|jgi:hypothetical protein|uniref:hypothetical protein n=1 Tax=Glaciecola punicea TaxID=56804 RepID=UPI0008730BE1|nr:hypothetical protein [Glaciecola punicea]OFA33236.1 hypothetical protein BAE46_00545 [Glaciecola punicea]
MNNVTNKQNDSGFSRVLEATLCSFKGDAGARQLCAFFINYFAASITISQYHENQDTMAKCRVKSELLAEHS